MFETKGHLRQSFMKIQIRIKNLNSYSNCVQSLTELIKNGKTRLTGMFFKKEIEIREYNFFNRRAQSEYFCKWLG